MPRIPAKTKSLKICLPRLTQLARAALSYRENSWLQLIGKSHHVNGFILASHHQNQLWTNESDHWAKPFSAGLETSRRTWSPQVLSSPACLTASTVLTQYPFSPASVQRFLLFVSLLAGWKLSPTWMLIFLQHANFHRYLEGNSSLPRDWVQKVEERQVPWDEQVSFPLWSTTHSLFIQFFMEHLLCLRHGIRLCEYHGE